MSSDIPQFHCNLLLFYMNFCIFQEKQPHPIPQIRRLRPEMQDLLRCPSLSANRPTKKRKVCCDSYIKFTTNMLLAWGFHGMGWLLDFYNLVVLVFRLSLLAAASQEMPSWRSFRKKRRKKRKKRNTSPKTKKKDCVKRKKRRRKKKKGNDSYSWRIISFQSTTF